MKKYNDNYYDSLLNRINSESKYSSHRNEIKTDFSLFVFLLKEFLLYIVLFIPYLVALLFSLLMFNSKSTKKYFEKIFLEPFRIVLEVFNWLFEAPVTAYLFLFLVFMYIVELVFLVPYLNNLMTYQLHFSQGNYYSVFTSIFLHANIVHLLSNCVALIIFGRVVEKHFKFNTLFIFLFSGIFANVVSNFISYYLGDLYYSLGASGAIAGLIILAILLEPFSLTSILVVPLPIFIVGWALIFADVTNLTTETTTNHLAHIGGYLGLIVIFFFLEFKNRKKITKGLIINLGMLGLLFLVKMYLNLGVYFN